MNMENNLNLYYTDLQLEGLAIAFTKVTAHSCHSERSEESHIQH